METYLKMHYGIEKSMLFSYNQHVYIYTYISIYITKEPNIETESGECLHFLCYYDHFFQASKLRHVTGRPVINHKAYFWSHPVILSTLSSPAWVLWHYDCRLCRVSAYLINSHAAARVHSADKCEQQKFPVFKKFDSGTRFYFVSESLIREGSVSSSASC